MLLPIRGSPPPPPRRVSPEPTRYRISCIVRYRARTQHDGYTPCVIRFELFSRWKSDRGRVGIVFSHIPGDRRRWAISREFFRGASTPLRMVSACDRGWTHTGVGHKSYRFHPAPSSPTRLLCFLRIARAIRETVKTYTSFLTDLPPAFLLTQIRGFSVNRKRSFVVSRSHRLSSPGRSNTVWWKIVLQNSLVSSLSIFLKTILFLYHQNDGNFSVRFDGFPTFQPKSSSFL